MAKLSDLATDYAAKAQSYKTALDAMADAQKAYDDHTKAAEAALTAMKVSEAALLQAARTELYGQGITGPADAAKAAEEPKE